MSYIPILSWPNEDFDQSARQSINLQDLQIYLDESFIKWHSTNCRFVVCVHFAQWAWILGHLQSLFAWLGGGQDDAGGDPGVAGGLLALRHRRRRVHLSVRAKERHEVTRKVTGLNFFSHVLKTQTTDIFSRFMGPFGIVSWSQSSLNKVGHSWKSQQTQVALKVPRWLLWK